MFKRSAPQLNSTSVPAEVPWVTYQVCSPDAVVPTKSTLNSAFFSLCAASSTTIDPYSAATLSTGISFQVPRHLVGNLYGVPGLLESGLVANPSFVPYDDDKEVFIRVRNILSTPVTIKKGEVIISVVFQRILNQKAIYPANQGYPSNPGYPAQLGYQANPGYASNQIYSTQQNHQVHHGFGSESTNQ